MKYYKLSYDYENDDDYVNCNVGVIGDIDEYSVSCGNYINDWSEVRFKYNSEDGDVLSDYIANVYRWLIVSKKFRELIEEIVDGNAIQYLSTKLIDIKNNVENTEYKIANLLDVVDALDLEHSQYDLFELDNEKIISVEKYALKEEMVFGHDIFRLKDDTIPIFISERIRDIIENNSLTGFAFIEVDVYYFDFVYIYIHRRSYFIKNRDCFKSESSVPDGRSTNVLYLG